VAAEVVLAAVISVLAVRKPLAVATAAWIAVTAAALG
jgi:hypothetical protein